MGMNKKQLMEALKNVASGKTKITDVITVLETSRKVAMTETDIPLSKGMNDKSAYFVKNGKIFSLPLEKIRNDGRKADFFPYYRTATATK